ncbi:molybdopterin-dependent oxidoreductase [Pyrobaculum neutrophilum]|uniref:Formate dehydrogenase n=1 Tax=Pyrobaculum neutrophilum (strain DSM 2338 / JCM 9278 / NBRC 100436 / V24Sta) TaxID=444157 RepID=B1YDX4_PYRNV|nr:molybdopterin-dependent oxidoreductase [Pyrobaculum neutrophilum]ACB39987.1 Formate dehydrogenase [Pyrobaculum neutrophilum V24Sta]
MTLATTRRGLLKIAAIAGTAFALPASGQVPFKEWKTQWALGEIGGKAEVVKASVVPVICPYCSMGCSIDMYVAGDRVVHSTGSQDSYINWGALCPKGKAAFQLVENELRLRRPLIRTGPKPPPEELLNAKSWDELVAVAKKYPPKWREVSWTEALQYIAERLGEILSRWRQSTGAPAQKDGYYYVGKDVPLQIIGSSILTNEEAFLSRKLAVFLGTANMDSQYRKCHSSTVSGLAVTYGWGAETASIEDVALADVVLFFSSPAEAHPLSFQYFLKGKRERGTIFIAFDPRYSRTAAASDIWVPFRPGTDAAVLNYILHYAFFERNPPIDQLPEFRRLMSRWNITDDDLADLKELLRDYTAEEVSRISGVPADLLRTVAQIYVENSGVVTNHKKHGVIQWAMGLTQHTNATINIIRAAAIVQLLLGNVGFPGGGTHPFRGHSNVQGANDVQGGGWDSLPGYHGNPTSAFEVRLYQDWKLQGMPDAWSWEVPQWARGKFSTAAPDKGKADLAKVLQVFKFYGWRRLELAWGLFCGTKPEEDPANGTVVCDFPFGTGSSEITFVRRALAGEIKAAIIFGENPAVTNPNAKLVWAALSSLELLVVSDIFQSETAWFADVVLPAASFAEKEGTRTDGNRVIQWTYRAVPPKGESRPDYWIITKLYEALRRGGVIQLPSEAAGVRRERVAFRKGGSLVFIYERPLRPDESWNYSGGTGKSTPVSPIEAEVNPRLINKEINFAVFIYQGIYDPIRDEFTTMRRSTRLRGEGEIDGVFSRQFKVYKDWGWSWPMNVRFLYNYDSLKAVLGAEAKVKAAGKEYVVTGETGEWIDEYTGEYKPAFIPGHNFWVPRAFKRRLSGVADLFGGLDLITYIRTGSVKIDGRFAVEEGDGVKTITYEEYAAKTGMRYLWVNDTLYWDEDTTGFKAAVKRPFFSGGGWRAFKPKMEQMRELLKRYYQESGSLKTATLKVISEMGGWYAGYNFQWPIHTEPVESPDVELALRYPTLAWLNPYNLSVLNEQPDIVKGKPVGVALEPKDLEQLPGELVVMTSNRLTEHFHSGTLTRNVPLLAELVPEPFVYVPKALAQKLGVSPGEYVDLITARGAVRLKAYVTEGEAYLEVNGRRLPVVNVVWSFSFLGYTTGAQANFINPDVGDVVTTIQESKAWLGKIKKAEGA